MKKLILLLSVAFVFGFSIPASAASITVKQGDSMWKIAQRYKVSFAEVLRLNSHYKDVNMIHVGDKINIPDGSQGTGTAAPSHSDNIHQGNDSAILGSVEAKEKEVLHLVNQQRKANGLKELTLSTKLISLAEMKSKDMADKNYFSHTSPTYGTPFEMLQKYGVSYRSAGENIAKGQATSEQVMQDWLNSSGHRANILSPRFTEIGIGYYDKHWVQLFIKP